MTRVQMIALLAALGVLPLLSLFVPAVSRATGRAWAFAVYLGILLLFLDAHFNIFREEGTNVDRSIRLLLGLGALALGLLQLPNTYRSLLRPPALPLLLFALFALLSTLYSATPYFTFEVGLILLGFVLFAPAAARLLTLRTMLLTAAASLGLFIVVSLALSYAFPEFGRTTGFWTPAGEVYRMDGLTAHANILGRLVALFLLVLLLLFLYRLIRPRFLAVPAAIGLLTLAFTGSRTSALALLAAGAVYALRLRPRLIVPGAAIAAVVAFFFLISPGAGGEVLEGFSRSGRSQEVVTLTGRTGLWTFVLEQIEASPWLGYGYGASRSVLASEYETLGWEAPHAHNMLLQSLHSVGIIGTAFLVLALLYQAVAFLERPIAFRDLPLLFVVIAGFTEAGPLRPEPNTLTLLWFISFFKFQESRGYRSRSRYSPTYVWRPTASQVTEPFWDTKNKPSPRAKPSMAGVGKLMVTAAALSVLLSASQSPTSTFLTAMSDSTLSEIQELIAGGFNVNLADEYGQTLLMHAAAANQDPEVITVLVTAGTEVNTSTYEGRTALMYAAWRNPSPEIIYELLRLGARASPRSSAGLTAPDYTLRNDDLTGTNARWLLRNSIANEEQPCVNINTASLEDLRRITTIGPVMSQRIVEQRPFQTVDDLIRVEAVDT
ncbi:MAG: O-antigen ligase family protein, partial [Deinococcota bacterium]|nr:O-antigen ligase family protein [Deinococcota bacterium]